MDWVEERFGPKVADNVDARLEKAFELLAAQPGVGHVRSDIVETGTVLFWPAGPSLVAYRVVGVDIEILAVERGSMDWSGLEGDL